MNDLDETDIDAALEDARGHHQAGRLAEAETLYRRVLDAQPRAAAVLSKLAAALAGQGKLDDALEALGRALDIDPDLVEAHNNLGTVQPRPITAWGCRCWFRESRKMRPFPSKTH